MSDVSTPGTTVFDVFFSNPKTRGLLFSLVFFFFFFNLVFLVLPLF
jgi:hypothetical protein